MSKDKTDFFLVLASILIFLAWQIVGAFSLILVSILYLWVGCKNDEPVQSWDVKGATSLLTASIFFVYFIFSSVAAGEFLKPFFEFFVCFRAFETPNIEAFRSSHIENSKYFAADFVASVFVAVNFFKTAKAKASLWQIYVSMEKKLKRVSLIRRLIAVTCLSALIASFLWGFVFVDFASSPWRFTTFLALGVLPFPLVLWIGMIPFILKSNLYTK